MYDPEKYSKFKFEGTFYEPSYSFALNYLELIKSEKESLKLFDLGCGPGKIAPYFDGVGIKEISGGDVNKEALEIAKSGNYYKKLYLLEGEEIIEDSETFDVVWASNVHFCESLSDYQKLTDLNNFASSLLKPNGIFIVLTAAPGILGQTFDSVTFQKTRNDSPVQDFDSINSIVFDANTGTNVFRDVFISRETHLKSFTESGFRLVDYQEPNKLSNGKKVNPAVSVYILEKI
jgi:SAM-dependent methyltransferase